LIPNWCFTN